MLNSCGEHADGAKMGGETKEASAWHAAVALKSSGTPPPPLQAVVLC